jgi:hypothetical protein
MINTYLNDLDAFISANDAVACTIQKLTLSLIIYMTGQLIM